MNRPTRAISRRAFLDRGAALGAAAIVADFSPARLTAIARAAARADTATRGARADDEEFWREVREAFTVAPTVINLDAAAVSPSPRVVTESMVRHVWVEQEAPTVMQDMLGPTVVNTARELAALLGCSMDEIALTRNATEALHNVLLGVELQRGDEVLTTTHDYWAMHNALDQRAAREGIVVRRVPVPAPAASMDQLVETIERGITPRTRLILISNPVNLTGQFFPVRRICDLAHAKGIEVCVDGAQGFAHTDFRIADLGCDYYGTSLHKWLMAPIGTGLLYIKREKIAKVWPLMPTDPEAPKDSNFKFMDIGTHSLAPAVAISDAIHFHQRVGARRKEERLRHLTRVWTDRLRALPGVRFFTSFDSPEMSCGIATFTLDRVSPDALQRYLWTRHAILVRDEWSTRAPGFRGVRVSPNVYTSPEDLDAFCDAVEQVARKGLPAAGS